MHANNQSKGVSFKVDPAELNRWKLAARKEGRTLAGFIKHTLNRRTAVIVTSEPKKIDSWPIIRP